jgi:hypothetical protein
MDRTVFDRSPYRQCLIGSILATFILLTAYPGIAAEIQIANSKDCSLTLTGNIEPGDTERFTRALKRLDEISAPRDPLEVKDEVFVPSICLDSAGGNYAEAIKIIDEFPSNLRTVIRPGAGCYSACALVFLAGRKELGFPDGWAPNRWLLPGGRLGFHGPYVNATGTGDFAVAYAAGVAAVAKLLGQSARHSGQRFFPADLLYAILQTGRDKFLEIKTVNDALRWDIRIGKLDVPPGTITGCNVARACQNYAWHKEMGIDADLLSASVNPSRLPKLKASSYPAKIDLTTFRRFSMTVDFERRGEFKCRVDLYVSNRNGLLLLIEHGHSLKEAGPKDKLSNIESWLGPLTGVSPGYLFKPSTDIASLATRNGKNAAFACDVEGEIEDEQ